MLRSFSLCSGLSHNGRCAHAGVTFCITVQKEGSCFREWRSKLEALQASMIFCKASGIAIQSQSLICCSKVRQIPERYRLGTCLVPTVRCFSTSLCMPADTTHSASRRIGVQCSNHVKREFCRPSCFRPQIDSQREATGWPRLSCAAGSLSPIHSKLELSKAKSALENSFPAFAELCVLKPISFFLCLQSWRTQRMTGMVSEAYTSEDCKFSIRDWGLS